MYEKVSPMHPDKLADRIAGALVDRAYQNDHTPKIAVEVLIGHGVCHVIIETSANILHDDIRLAISLGDRFLYQRELFGQNAELMQKTLTELNSLGSFEEAMNYISRFNWDQESNSYQQFIVTLHRRFG